MGWESIRERRIFMHKILMREEEYHIRGLERETRAGGERMRKREVEFSGKVSTGLTTQGYLEDFLLSLTVMRKFSMPRSCSHLQCPIWSQNNLPSFLTSTSIVATAILLVSHAACFISKAYAPIPSVNSYINICFLIYFFVSSHQDASSLKTEVFTTAVLVPYTVLEYTVG